MTTPGNPSGREVGSSRRGQDAKVLLASAIPILCAFGLAVQLGRAAARPPVLLDLSKPQVLVGLRGFSAPESWGRWTDGREAALVFAAPLPERFDLTLDAWAYGPNVGRPVELQAGGATGTLVLGASLSRQTVSFRGAGGRSLVFHIPRPSSPRQLGEGGDERQLGIALGRVAIQLPVAAGS